MNGAGPEGPPAATGRELFAAGFVTFSLLYETQPVLPLLAAAEAHAHEVGANVPRLGHHNDEGHKFCPVKPGQEKTRLDQKTQEP